MYHTPAHQPHSQPVAEFRTNQIINLGPIVGFFLFFSFFLLSNRSVYLSTTIRLALLILISLVAIAVLTVAYRRTVYRILFYSEGMLIKSGQNELFLAWEEITATNLQISQQRGFQLYYYYVYKANGQKFRIGPWDRIDLWFKLFDNPVQQLDLEAAMNFIQNASFKARLNHAVSRLEQGDWIDFKHFALSKLGIRHKERVRHWKLIKQIDIADERIVVHALGESKPWAIVKLDLVPNRDLVQAIIARYNGDRLGVFQARFTEPLPIKQIKQPTKIITPRLLAPFIYLLILISVAGGAFMYNSSANNQTALWKKGETALDRGDGAAALEIFDQIVKRDPKNAQAYLYRGHSYAFLEQYDLALADYQQADRLLPNNEAVIFYFGRLYQRQSQWDRSISYYYQSLKLYKDNRHTHYSSYPWVFYRLAQVYRELGDYNEALRQLALGLDAPKVEEDVRTLMLQERKEIQQLLR